MNIVFLELALKQCKLLIQNIVYWHLIVNKIAVCHISMHQDLFLNSKMLFSFLQLLQCYTGLQHPVLRTVRDIYYCYPAKAADLFKKTIRNLRTIPH